MAMAVHLGAAPMEVVIQVSELTGNHVGKNNSNNLAIAVSGKKQKMKCLPGLGMKRLNAEENLIDVCRIWKKVVEVWKIMDKATTVVRLYLHLSPHIEEKGLKHTGDLMIGLEKIFRID